MSADPLLPHVRALLSTSISSVAQLELLIFLHAQRARAWSPADASAELRSNPAWILAQLEELASRGLLVREGERYRLGDRADLVAAVEDLARAYRTFPVTVVSAIYPAGSSPNRGLQHFSDAFRLRRKPDTSTGQREDPRA